MAFQEVSEATLRRSVVTNLFTLIDDNKLSGWTVLAAFPEKKATFPCIIINPANVSLNKIGTRVDARINKVTVLAELFSPSSSRLEALDIARDNIQETIVNNTGTLATYKMALGTDEPFIESDVDTIQFNEQNLKTSAVQLSFDIL